MGTPPLLLPPLTISSRAQGLKRCRQAAPPPCTPYRPPPLLRLLARNLLTEARLQSCPLPPESSTSSPSPTPAVVAIHVVQDLPALPRHYLKHQGEHADLADLFSLSPS